MRLNLWMAAAAFTATLGAQPGGDEIYRALRSAQPAETFPVSNVILKRDVVKLTLDDYG